MRKILDLTQVFLQSFLKGKLTYITGGIMIAFGIFAYANNTIAAEESMKIILEGLAICGFRRSISGVEPK